MPETIKAVYDSKEKVLNAVDDLVSTGIPREKIKVDDASSTVSVVIPATSSPEIKEILQRHQPTDVHE